MGRSWTACACTSQSTACTNGTYASSGATSCTRTADTPSCAIGCIHRSRSQTLIHANAPASLPACLHRVLLWHVQRRHGRIVHGVPRGQHQRCRRDDVLVQRRLLWHGLWQLARLHRYAARLYSPPCHATAGSMHAALLTNPARPALHTMQHVERTPTASPVPLHASRARPTATVVRRRARASAPLATP